jgi:serpin B
LKDSALSLVRMIGVLIFVAGTLAVTGCEWLWPTHEWTGDVASSTLDRDTDPDVSTADVQALVVGNSSFAFDLLHALSPNPGNLFYCPFSISTALAMTYAGASGDTETQMASTLHFDLDPDDLHAAFNFLDLALNSRGMIEPPYEGEGFDLAVVNAAWGQRGYVFLRNYLDVLAENYGAGVRLVDFEADPDGSREAINAWVSQETNDKVTDLLPPDAIDATTRLVLTNAVYFSAPWLDPFDADQTQAGAFESLDGNTVYVPMMRQEGYLNYAAWNGGQAVELPYNGSALSMVVLVPDRGTYATFEAGLDDEQYERILSELESRPVTLQLPRFQASFDTSLVDPLTELGMADAFVAGVADFSGINGRHDLFIADVLHKAWISVDEAGTEAAAATAVLIPIGGAGEPVTLTIDRPFLFAIRDIETNTILFLGRIVEIEG